MNYDFYLDKTLLPVTPEKLSVKTKSGSQTINLINEGMVSLIKKSELAEIEFECLFPAKKYPFARYPDGFKAPDLFIGELKGLKAAPFQFIVSRNGADGVPLSSTNMTVTLEDFTLSESAKNLFDVTADIRLREYREFKAKVVKAADNSSAAEEKRSPSTVQSVPVSIGSEVVVNGRLYGSSYGDAPGKTLTNYRGKINFINLKGSHPYHVTTPDGGWLGWVLSEAVKAVT